MKDSVIVIFKPLPTLDAYIAFAKPQETMTQFPQNRNFRSKLLPDPPPARLNLQQAERNCFHSDDLGPCRGDIGGGFHASVGNATPPNSVIVRPAKYLKW